MNSNMRGVIGSRDLRVFIIQYDWLSDKAWGGGQWAEEE